MLPTSPAKAFLFVFGIFSMICESLNQNLIYDRHDVELKEATTQTTLRCYDCNSAYDYRCADPFDSYSIGILNCSSRKTPEHLVDHLHPEREVKPMVCRKITQKVEGKVRVIRGCGYISDDTDDKRCFRRTGTSGVEVYYCACTTNLCNKGEPSVRLNKINNYVKLGLALAITTFLVNRITQF